MRRPWDHPVPGRRVCALSFRYRSCAKQQRPAEAERVAEWVDWSSEPSIWFSDFETRLFGLSAQSGAGALEPERARLQTELTSPTVIGDDIEGRPCDEPAFS